MRSWGLGSRGSCRLCRCRCCRGVRRSMTGSVRRGRRSWSFLDGDRNGLGFERALELMANFLGNVDRNRAGVGLLFTHTKARKQVNDCFRLDLQLAGQFVNSDLGWITHTSLRILLFLLVLVRVVLGSISGRRVRLLCGGILVLFVLFWFFRRFFGCFLLGCCSGRFRFSFSLGF